MMYPQKRKEIHYILKSQSKGTLARTSLQLLETRVGFPTPVERWRGESATLRDTKIASNPSSVPYKVMKQL